MHNNLLWLDMETTGLDPQTDLPLQIGVSLRDDQGIAIEEHEFVIAWPSPILDARLSPYVRNMHTKSGLLARVTGPYACGLGALDTKLAAWSKERFPNIKPTLAGNSIHFDRGFLKRHFPLFEATLHYRMLDVSSLKIAAAVWGFSEYKKPEAGHTTLSDIQDSVDEFKHWRDTFAFGFNT